MWEFTVDEKLQGKTLKEYFAEMQFSTTLVKRFKLRGKMLANGKPVDVCHVLVLGEHIVLTTDEKLQTPTFSPVAATVVWEDKYLYVAEKPFGVAIHPDRAHAKDTLGNRLATYFGKGFELRIVTRLDKTTSGLVLGAKNALAAERLNQLQLQRKIEKTYIALVEGEVDEGATISLPLLRVDAQNKTVVDEKGKTATTTFEVQERFPTATLLKVFPKTGRTHQIRAHLSAIGHPIVGDVLYGAQAANRICLHCAKLEFAHPFTGQTVVATSDCKFDKE